MKGYFSASRIPQSKFAGPSPFPIATIVSHPGLSRACNHVVAISVELLAFEMCMRINKHNGRSGRWSYKSLVRRPH